MDCTNLNFGGPLSLNEADQMLNKHLDLLKHGSTLRINTNYEDLTIAQEFVHSIKDRNAFIFDKKSFMDLFDKGADFIMIVAGAHTEQKPIKINGRDYIFDNGSATLMLVGCKSVCVNNRVESLEAVDVESIREYPPSKFIEDIPTKKDLIKLTSQSTSQIINQIKQEGIETKYPLIRLNLDKDEKTLKVNLINLEEN